MRGKHGGGFPNRIELSATIRQALTHTHKHKTDRNTERTRERDGKMRESESTDKHTDTHPPTHTHTLVTHTHTHNTHTHTRHPQQLQRLHHRRLTPPLPAVCPRRPVPPVAVPPRLRHHHRLAGAGTSSGGGGGQGRGEGGVHNQGRLQQRSQHLPGPQRRTRARTHTPPGIKVNVTRRSRPSRRSRWTRRP